MQEEGRRRVRRRQDAQKPVSVLSSQEVHAGGHEQRRLVQLCAIVVQQFRITTYTSK